jgi:hypothetical protein
MKRVVVLAILILGFFSAGAADSGGVSYESFRIVLDRNIFDPGRSPGRTSRTEAPDVPIPPPSQSDRVSLYGALIYEGTAVAFFSGTRDEYNRAARQGEAIAGYRVIEIRTQSVELERDGERIELPVGGGLSRSGEGGWTIVTESPVLDRGREASRERSGEEASQRADIRSEAGRTGSPSAQRSDATNDGTKKTELEK